MVYKWYWISKNVKRKLFALDRCNSLKDLSYPFMGVKSYIVTYLLYKLKYTWLDECKYTILIPGIWTKTYMSSFSEPFNIRGLNSSPSDGKISPSFTFIQHLYIPSFPLRWGRCSVDSLPSLWVLCIKEHH